MTSAPTASPGRDQLLDRVERFYDAVPRVGVRVEEFGPLVLFVREGEGWPFYGRPRLGDPRPPTAADVDRVRARQRELRVPESFEWVAETTPGLRAAVEESGLAVREHPLMVLSPDVPVPDVPVPDTPGPGASGTGTPCPAKPSVVVPGGLAVRILGPSDPALPTALTVPHLAFAAPGTQVGAAGPAELARGIPVHGGAAALDRAAARMASGGSAWAAAVDGTTALCSGQYNRVGGVCEIVGVGTLPSARRRGLALAVTATLVADARSRGVGTVFLSAGDEDVARIYARLGFRRVGTALIAEPH
jgi:GNAT superfamily N-acetyltransferase